MGRASLECYSGGGSNLFLPQYTRYTIPAGVHGLVKRQGSRQSIQVITQPGARLLVIPVGSVKDHCWGCLTVCITNKADVYTGSEGVTKQVNSTKLQGHLNHNCPNQCVVLVTVSQAHWEHHT